MQRIIKYLIPLFLFLLPWQTRYIWHYGGLNKGYWEYGTFSIYGTEILLWVILLMFFVRHFWNRESWTKLREKKSRTSLVLVLFLLSLALSTALSKNFWVSYYFIFHFLEAMALMVVLAGVISPLPRGSEEGVAEALANSNQTNPPLPRPSGELTSRNNRLMMALWLGGVGQGVLAVIQFLTQHVWVSKWLGMAGQEAKDLGPSVIEFADQRWLRAYGSFGSPNSLGMYLAVLFVLGLILYISPSAREGVGGVGAESARTKILISVGQLLILSGLLVSFSRGAWLAAAVGILSLLLVLFKNCHSERSEESLSQLSNGQRSFALFRMTTVTDLFKQLMFAVVVVIFWLAIFYPVFTARFNLNNRLEAKSISERQGQYSEALSFIKSNPLFGVGPGAYTYALYKKYPTLPAWQLQPIHNIYLLALVEIGFVGVILLFFLLKYLFVRIFKNNLIYFPVILALFFAGFFDHWLWSMYTGVVLFWLIIGLANVYKNKQTE